MSDCYPNDTNPNDSMVPVYGGILKREIVKRAYAVCGQSSSEFETTPEEMAFGVQCMNDTLAMLQDQRGICLGYNFPPAASFGSGEDESGIPRGAVQAVVQIVARELAPMIGATLPPTANGSYASAMSLLLATYSRVPTMNYARGTIAGAGSRYRRLWGGPFLPSCPPDDGCCP